MALEGYKCNHNVIYSSKYNVVWTPKYRRPVLEGAIAKRCQALIRQVAAKYDAEIFSLEILSDQVHLLCEVDPQFGIHRLVKNVKAVSSHTLRKEFPVLRSRLPTLWTNSYLVAASQAHPWQSFSNTSKSKKISSRGHDAVPQSIWLRTWALRSQSALGRSASLVGSSLHASRFIYNWEGNFRPMHDEQPGKSQPWGLSAELPQLQPAEKWRYDFDSRRIEATPGNGLEPDPRKRLWR